jgi:hypothetical protein
VPIATAIEYVIQLDADGQHRPMRCRTSWRRSEAGTADVVIGSRFVEASEYRMGHTRTLGRKLLGRLLLMLGGPTVADPTSGLQALARPAFQLCCGEFYRPISRHRRALFLHRQGLRPRRGPRRHGAEPGRAKSRCTAGCATSITCTRCCSRRFRSRLGPRPRARRDATLAPRSHEEVRS